MNVSLIELLVRRGSHCPRGTNSVADNVLHMLARSWYQGNMADIVFGLVNMVSRFVLNCGKNNLSLKSKIFLLSFSDYGTVSAHPIFANFYRN